MTQKCKISWLKVGILCAYVAKKIYNCKSVLGNIYISARLDGTGEKMRSKMSQHSSIEDWLELGSEIVDRKPTKLGQKRVRWLLSRDIIANRQSNRGLPTTY